MDDTQFSPRTVWQSTIREAVDRDVDALLVAGDLVDEAHHYFEAYGALEDGATTLDEAGIQLIVVAGNHDYEALPRLVDEVDLDTLELLGADGSWERITIRRGDESVAYVDGWSFTQEHQYDSPLENYVRSTDDDLPVVGLLHADFGQRSSDYAPVRREELLETGADAWVLGHIHSPGVRIDSDPITFYTGSLEPLDPGEPGGHGPWLLEADDTGVRRHDHIVDAPLRYEAIDVDVAGVDDPMDVPSAVDEAVSAFESEHDLDPVELLLLRVRLTGRTPAHGDLIDAQSRIAEQLSFTGRGHSVHIESIEIDTRPAIDLVALAGDDTPAAYLADLLLSLDDLEDRERPKAKSVAGGAIAEAQSRENLDDAHEELINDALTAIQDVQSGSAYRELRQERGLADPDRSDAIDVVRRQARTLLDTLVEQRGDRP